jgi:hypothetical protein
MVGYESNIIYAFYFSKYPNCGVVWGVEVVGQGSHPCVFTIFYSKSFFKKSKLDIYKCPFLKIPKYFWKIDDL